MIGRTMYTIEYTHAHMPESQKSSFIPYTGFLNDCFEPSLPFSTSRSVPGPVKTG